MPDSAVFLLGAGSLPAFLAILLGRKRLARARKARPSDSGAADGGTAARADHDRREIGSEAGAGGDGGGH